MKKILTLAMLAILSISSFWATAHGGLTDSDGCHDNRENGTRHCH